MPLIYLDGRFVDRDSARVAVNDHGLLFGDGVFELFRFYHRVPFRLSQHLARLYSTAATIDLELPLSESELSDAVLRTIAANSRQSGIVRLTVTRGAGTLNLDPRKCDPVVMILVEEMRPYPIELARCGISVIAMPSERPGGPPRKTLSYLSETTARHRAIRAGVSDAVLLHPRGHVLGTAAGNLFLVRRGELHTPPIAEDVFPGVTRAVVLELAHEMRIPVSETPFPLETVAQAEEVFLTSSAAGIVPILRCQGKPIGSGSCGPITELLRQQYQILTYGSVPTVNSITDREET